MGLFTMDIGVEVIIQNFTNFQKPYIVKRIKISRLKRGHLMRMTKNPPSRRITEATAWGRRRVGRPCLRWMEGVTEDLHRMRINNWKDKAG
jgi:hypothetical protein